MKKRNLPDEIIEKECWRLLRKYGISRVEKMLKKLEERENYEACQCYFRVINQFKNEELNSSVI